MNKSKSERRSRKSTGKTNGGGRREDDADRLVRPDGARPVDAGSTSVQRKRDASSTPVRRKRDASSTSVRRKRGWRPVRGLDKDEARMLDDEATPDDEAGSTVDEQVFQVGTYN